MSTITIKFPLDILLCLFYSFLLIPFIYLNINDILQMILALPFLIFIPGYLFLLFIAPSHLAKAEMDAIHKLAISIGLSIAIVSLDGIFLFYTPFGFHLNSIVASLLLIVTICGSVAIYRRKRLQQQNKYALTLSIPSIESKSRMDKILIFILACAIILTVFTAAFISFLPIKQESFTEFYILGASASTIHYPKNLIRGENATVTIGLVNHEHKTIDYTIEIWLVNQTLTYDNTSKTMNTTYHEMLFLNKTTVTLNDNTTDENLTWQSQWTQNYTFNINKTGQFTLMFLLFTSPAPAYVPFQDYPEIAESEIQNAYQSLYIWLNIHK
jgi:uncharacterized membrane protein